MNPDKIKKKLIVTSPYLNNIGGTEIETINIAVSLYDTGYFHNITIFTPLIWDKNIFKEIVGGRKIKFICYPLFFSTGFNKLIVRFFNFFNLSVNISQSLYWKYKMLFYDYYFILTNNRNNYFYPIVLNNPKNKKILLKLTMYHYEKVSYLNQFLFKNLSAIVLFNDMQKTFWEDKYEFKNIVALDVTISNETDLLRLETRNSQKLVFGYLGRISIEKNIEEMILLIDHLINKRKVNCRLIIQGEGNPEYENKLIKLIRELELSNYITFINTFLSPMETYKFFNKIDVFLVLSLHEGGPITALEAAAAGRIVIGYDVGAMKDRFSSFPCSISRNFDELCSKAYQIVSLSTKDRINLANTFRIQYLYKLNNTDKTEKLLKLLRIEKNK